MEKLKKELSFIDLFAVAAGAMISSGLFILPGIGFKKAGPAVIFSYLLAGVLYIPALFSKTELATAMPKAGGNYFFIDRSLGPAAGTLGGVAAWLAMALKSAFALIGIGATAVLLIPDITQMQIKLIAVIFCVGFTILNLSGAKHAGKMQIIFVGSVLVILIVYVLKGLYSINPNNYLPFSPHGPSAVITTAGMVFISYGGLTKIAELSEETKDPGKNIPRAMFVTFLSMTFLYVLVVFVTIGVLSPAALSKTLTPIKDSARILAGGIGLKLTALAALLAFVTTANGGILAASRSPVAMARDKHLPEFFARINEKNQTPQNSLIFTSLFMIVMILVLDIKSLVKTASCMQIILFILVILSVIVMRESKIHSYRPLFKSPFYPYIHIIGIIGYIGFLATIGFKPLGFAGAFLVAAFLWYFFYTKPFMKREPALLHMVENIISIPRNESLIRPELSKELKDIVKDRDQVIEDYFDRIMKEAKIIDLQWGMPATGFYRKASKILADELELDKNELYNQLMEKESVSPANVRPGLAICTLSVKEECPFQLLVARNVYGVEFSPIRPPVYAIFLIVCPEHQKWLNTRFIMSLAEITQDGRFDRQWLQARGEEELRSLLMVAKRRRMKDIYSIHIYEALKKVGMPIEDKKIKKIMDRHAREAKAIRQNALYGIPLTHGFDENTNFLVMDPNAPIDFNGNNDDNQE